MSFGHEIDVVFTRANLSRNHAALLDAFEMSEDTSDERPRRPLNDLRLSELRGAAVGYYKGWSFLVHPHAAFALVPSSFEGAPEPSDQARRLGELAPESFALWTDPSTQSSAFGLLRGGRWARVRVYSKGSVTAEFGKPLPFERDSDLDHGAWPRAATRHLLGVELAHILESDILSATVHAPW